MAGEDTIKTIQAVFRTVFLRGQAIECVAARLRLGEEVVKYGVKNDVKKGVRKRGWSCARHPRWLTLLFTSLFTVFFALLFTYKRRERSCDVRRRGRLSPSLPI